jgi:putative DNA primase/helicase
MSFDPKVYVNQAKAEQQQTKNGSGEAPAQPPTFAAAETIGASPVTWLWYPRLPASQITLLGAPGGGGKGLNAVEYTACITTGRNWPASDTPAPLGNVLWCEAEDPLPEVVVPRLIAAGADRTRVQFATRDQFATAQDGLRAYILERSVQLIVLSPFVSFIDLTDINGELGVRDSLERLQDRITGTGCASLGLAHTNKKPDLRAIERLLGAVAFSNFARSVLLVARDHADTNWFRLVHAKHNLSIKADDLLYRPLHVGQDPRDQFVKLEWRKPDENVETDTMFDRNRSKANGKKPAGTWLVDYLERHGRSLASNVLEAAEKAGYSYDAIRMAQYRESRIKNEKEGFPGQVFWWL